MPNTMPPTPYKSQITNSAGFLTPAWAAFFRELFFRIGGSIAPTNAELDSGSTTIQADVTALQSTTTTLGTRVTVLEGLGIGRQL